MSSSFPSNHGVEGVAPPVLSVERVESTNDLALTLAAEGAADFTAVVADEQTAGRGRHGRAWWSPPGSGLYLSVIVRTPQVGAVAQVSLAAGVACARAVHDVTGLPVELKWPNDVVIGRPWRKLAGILCEGSQVGQPEGVVIVGMGVNLRRSAYPPEIADRATSIAEECGRDVERDALRAAAVAALAEQVARLREGRTAEVLDGWRAWGAVALDRAPVRWRTAEGEQRGTTVGLDEDGALLVRPMGGAVPQRILSGEVTWEMLTRD